MAHRVGGARRRRPIIRYPLDVELRRPSIIGQPYGLGSSAGDSPTGHRLARAQIPPFHVMDVWAAAGERQRTHGDLVNLSAGPALHPGARPRCGRRPPRRWPATCSATPSRWASRRCAPRSPSTTAARYGLDVAARAGRGRPPAPPAASCWRSSPRSTPATGWRMARPGYPCYRNILTALGCEVVELPCGPRDPLPADRGDAGGARRAGARAGAWPARPTRPAPCSTPASWPRSRSYCERTGDPAGQRRDLPRHLLPRRPRDVVRVGDLARGDRRQLVLQVLLDDRLAAGLAAACRRGCCARSTAWPATSPSARPRCRSSPRSAAFTPESYAEADAHVARYGGQPRPAARRA